MISVEGLTVEFGGFTLFDDVSFVVNKKDRIALVGKNGAGKSTLAKIIAGELELDSGTLRILGKDISCGMAEFHQLVGVVELRHRPCGEHLARLQGLSSLGGGFGVGVYALRRGGLACGPRRELSCLLLAPLRLALVPLVACPDAEGVLRLGEHG